MRGIDSRLGTRPLLAAIACAVCLTCVAHGAVVVRQRVAEGIFASVRDGQFIFLECRPGGAAAQQTLSPYLADPSLWTRYKGLENVAIPMPQLGPEAQRKLIETLFTRDYADDRGWWHTVTVTGEQGQETWQAVSDWLTGSTRNVATLLHLPENASVGGSLERGERLFIPKNLLLLGLRAPSPNRPTPSEAVPVKPPVPQPPKAAPESRKTRQTEVAAAGDPRNPGRGKKEARKGKAPLSDTQPAAEAAPPVEAAPVRETPAPKASPKSDEVLHSEDAPQAAEPDLESDPAVEVAPAPHAAAVEDEGEGGEPARLVEGELKYSKDSQGPYAAYRLKRGEALYTSVVVRFTDFQTPEDINAACISVLQRSGISDPRHIDAGQTIRIPMEILSDRYWPEGSDERSGFESIRKEAAQLDETRVSSKGLDGVVVIIDPGHGGNDQGAACPSAGLYEDELNYDIACRLKDKLEKSTHAKVYMTLSDPKQGYKPRDVTKFSADKNEEVLTTPHYWNEDAKVSVNLRWYLANDIYRRECAKGLDPRKVVFLSIHCDALHEKMRGTMVYVPGAKYRRDREQPPGAVYANYKETGGHAAATTTARDRTRDEAVSRNFAQAVIDSLRESSSKIAINKHGDPIRNVIRKSGGKAYVPAVLRNNNIPTKVLVETANLNNPSDQERLADPKWRQGYAQSLANALLTYFRN